MLIFYHKLVEKAIKTDKRPDVASAWKQLRMMSVNMESSTQTLGEEAINLLFEKHRLNRIA
jgi:uridine phosphorylase